MRTFATTPDSAAADEELPDADAVTDAVAAAVSVDSTENGTEETPYVSNRPSEWIISRMKRVPYVGNDSSFAGCSGCDGRRSGVRRTGTGRCTSRGSRSSLYYEYASATCSEMTKESRRTLSVAALEVALTVKVDEADMIMPI